MPDPNLPMLQDAAGKLAPFLDEIVFVGGITLGLLITDQAAAPIRGTTDVDVIAEIATYADYIAFSERLRRAHFTEDQELTCRWHHDALTLDVLALNKEVLGFTNSWYEPALRHALPITLPGGPCIRVITAPYFLATKMEAFRGRGRMVAAQQGVARAESQLTNSEGGLQSAQATRLETHVREGQFATARAAVAQASAALKDAELQLSYTIIQAPVSGRIGKKSVEAGQRVQIGQPLMAIVEDHPWVVANFKETQLEKMRAGQSVDVEIDTFPKHKFHGYVDSLAPGSGNEFALLPPDNATGNFTKIVQRVPVKIVLDRDSTRGYENLISPGMSSVVTVSTQ